MRIRLYDVTRITRTGLVPHSAIDAEDVRLPPFTIRCLRKSRA